MAKVMGCCRTIIMCIQAGVIIMEGTRISISEEVGAGRWSGWDEVVWADTCTTSKAGINLVVTIQDHPSNTSSPKCQTKQQLL